MKKMIATLAIAGLGAALAVGAQAQTIKGTVGGSSVYTATFTGVATGSSSPYTYTYTASGVTGSASINSVQFNSLLGYISGTATSSAFGTPTVLTSGPFTTLIYSGGILANNQTFSFQDTLPPVGTLGVLGSASSASGVVNTGGLALGQSPGVPEAGSFALLGLGLLPLAFVARRRINN